MFLLLHHTGASARPPNPGWSDAQHMAALQSYAKGAGKTWEYNYVITYPEGWIWEMAGPNVGSHCLNANTYSYGVQINQGDATGPAGRKQVDSFRWLVWFLKQNGQLHPNADIGPHYRLRATGCSMNDLALPNGPRWNSPSGQGSLGSVRPEFLVPWAGDPGPPPPIPPPPIQEDDEMQFLAAHPQKGVALYNVSGAGVTRVQVYTSPDQGQFQSYPNTPLLKLTADQIDALDREAGASRDRAVSAKPVPFNVKLVDGAPPA